VPLTPQAIRKVAHRYQESGLERALYEKERPGAATLLEDSQKQRIIAMVCSDPPEGRAGWTVRLVVEEAIKRKLVPKVGRETIRILLLHHDLKPWREKNVVRRCVAVECPVDSDGGRMDVKRELHVDSAPQDALPLALAARAASAARANVHRRIDESELKAIRVYLSYGAAQRGVPVEPQFEL
jgi:hypothetical protein